MILTKVSPSLKVGVDELRTEKRCFGASGEGDQVREEKRTGKLAGAGHHPRAENAMRLRIRMREKSKIPGCWGKPGASGSESCLQARGQLAQEKSLTTFQFPLKVSRDGQ